MAEIAKEILFEEGIQSVDVNKKDSNYLIGAIEIYVERENVIRGKYMLKDIEKHVTDDPGSEYNEQ